MKITIGQVRWVLMKFNVSGLESGSDLDLDLDLDLGLVWIWIWIWIWIWVLSGSGSGSGSGGRWRQNRSVAVGRSVDRSASPSVECVTVVKNWVARIRNGSQKRQRNGSRQTPLWRALTMYSLFFTTIRTLQRNVMIWIWI